MSDDKQLQRDRAFVAAAKARQIIKAVVAVAALVMAGYAGYSAATTPEVADRLYPMTGILGLLAVWQVVTMVLLGKQATQARARIAAAEGQGAD